MQIRLRKARGWFSFDRAISLCSGGWFGGYSHAELVFSDGRSFSSTTRAELGGTGGVRFAKIDYTGQDADWDVYELAVSLGEEIQILEAAKKIVGSPYDYAACARFLIPFWREHPRDYMCSECVIEVCKAGGFFRDIEHPWRFSPNDLGKYLAAYINRSQFKFLAPWSK